MNELKEIDWNKVKKLLSEDKRSLSEKLDNKLNQYPAAKIVLMLLAAGCFLSLVAVSPGAASLAGVWKSFNKRRFRQTINRFKEQKYVEIKNKNGQPVVSVTTKGLNKVLSYKMDGMEIKKPNAWDHKWRLVIFDIKDKHRSDRDLFRNKIKSMGLWELQKSVYVYPYPCFDEVEFLRQIFGVGLDVKYIMADKIEDDENIRYHFEV